MPFRIRALLAATLVERPAEEILAFLAAGPAAAGSTSAPPSIATTTAQ